MRGVDEALEALARRQHGLITRRQARAAGLSDEAIRHRIETRRWIRVRPGLYALVGSDPTWNQAVHGAVLLSSCAAYASHATSARLWGDPSFPEWPLETTVPLGCNARISGVRTHRSGTLEIGDLREVDGIPTLSAARTAADLSSRVDIEGLARFVDEGLRRGIVTLAGLDRVARRLAVVAPGRSPKKLAAVLRDRVPGYHPSGSELEDRVLRALIAAGLPPPQRQFRVVIDDRVYFVDLAYPHERIAIEVDGFEFHRARGVFDSDRARQNDLVRAGWIVLRFTSRSVAQEIVSAVRGLLFDRSSGS